jgi:hypothetical protein
MTALLFRIGALAPLPPFQSRHPCRAGRAPTNSAPPESVSHSGPSRPNPLKTKAKHSQPPNLKKFPCYLDVRQRISNSEKALRTRRKVFCREPPCSLPRKSTAASLCSERRLETHFKSLGHPRVRLCRPRYLKTEYQAARSGLVTVEAFLIRSCAKTPA